MLSKDDFKILSADEKLDVLFDEISDIKSILNNHLHTLIFHDKIINIIVGILTILIFVIAIKILFYS